MASNFTTDVSDNGKSFKLIFTCDNKDDFIYMVEAARCCIDGGPFKRLIKEFELKQKIAEIQLYEPITIPLLDFEPKFKATFDGNHKLIKTEEGK